MAFENFQSSSEFKLNPSYTLIHAFHTFNPLLSLSFMVISPPFLCPTFNPLLSLSYFSSLGNYWKKDFQSSSEFKYTGVIASLYQLETFNPLLSLSVPCVVLKLSIYYFQSSSEFKENFLNSIVSGYLNFQSSSEFKLHMFMPSDGYLFLSILF